MRLPPIDRYMTAIPYTIDPDMSGHVALEMMRRHGVRHLPVESEDKIVGILSDWDMVAASSSGTMERVLDRKVGELMTGDPVTVSRNSSLDHVIALMDRDGIGSVLITDHGQIIGIFTEKDAIHAFAGLHPYEGRVGAQALQ